MLDFIKSVMLVNENYDLIKACFKKRRHFDRYEFALVWSSRIKSAFTR